METKFDNLDKQSDDIEKDLKCGQNLISSEETFKLCALLKKQLDDLYEKQEAFWYLRSRVAEIKDGDRNVKYFHYKASQKQIIQLCNHNKLSLQDVLSLSLHLQWRLV